MKTFNIYRHETEGFEAVKVGFSWPAFFFGTVWMLISGLWLLAASWITMLIVLRFIQAYTDSPNPTLAQACIALVLLVCYLVLWLAPAFKGNKWRDRNLCKQGYKCIATIQAKNPAEATAQVINAA